MKKLVFGVVDRYEYSQIEPWVVSLKKSGYEGDIGLLCYNINKDTLEKLNAQGVKLYAVNKDNNGNTYYNDNNIMVSRFCHTYQLLEKSDYEYILFTDVRDVLFQCDPLSFPKNETPSELMLGSENIPYRLEAWNKNNMILAFGEDIYGRIQDKFVNCAGVIGGRKEALLDFFCHIYLMCKNINPHIEGGGGPDQAAMNILSNLYPWKDRIKIFTGLDTWVCHAGTTDDAIYDGTNENYMSFVYKNDIEAYRLLNKIETRKRPVLKDGMVCNHEGLPYAILHQYDRVASWAVLKDKYRG